MVTAMMHKQKPHKTPDASEFQLQKYIPASAAAAAAAVFAISKPWRDLVRFVSEFVLLSKQQRGLILDCS